MPTIRHHRDGPCQLPINREGLMMKIIAAVIAGLITWILVATAVNLLLRILWPHYHEAEIGFNFTLGMMIARLTLGAVSSVCGGFVVAWIAKANSGRSRSLVSPCLGSSFPTTIC